MQGQEKHSLLREIHGTFNYKIVIPQEVEQKICYLLKKVHNIEWSGKLFYDYKGTFEDNNLEIICRDIFLMDIGTSAYTEFDDDSTDFGNYMLTHKLLKCKIGLCHSHHSMDTFFSGVDQNTLLENGMEMNNFVSLIVNNAGDYKAAITRKVTVKKDIKEDVCYPFFNEPVQTLQRDNTKEVQYVEWYDLIIDKQCSPALQELDKRIEEIKAKNTRKSKYDFDTSFLPVTPTTYQYTKFYIPNHNSQPSYENEEKKPTPASFDKFVGTHLTMSEVMHLSHQIITGNVFTNILYSEDLNTWEEQMVSIYDKTFRKKDNFDEFVDWYTTFIIEKASIELYQQYVTIYKDGIGEHLNSNIFIPFVVDAVLEELYKFPTNIYIQAYINQLIYLKDLYY